MAARKQPVEEAPVTYEQTVLVLLANLVTAQRETNEALAETNSYLAGILNNQKTDEIIYKLEDIGLKVFAAGHW